MSDLHLGQHISRRFNEELEEVRTKVLHMGGIVESQLANALRVMVNDEPALAKEVAKADHTVNSLEISMRSAPASLHCGNPLLRIYVSS